MTERESKEKEDIEIRGRKKGGDEKGERYDERKRGRYERL